MNTSKEMDNVNENKIKESNVTAKEQHRHDHDNGGVEQLLVATEAFFLRIPGPGTFL